MAFWHNSLSRWGALARLTSRYYRLSQWGTSSKSTSTNLFHTLIAFRWERLYWIPRSKYCYVLTMLIQFLFGLLISSLWRQNKLNVHAGLSEKCRIENKRQKRMRSRSINRKSPWHRSLRLLIPSTRLHENTYIPRSYSTTAPCTRPSAPPTLPMRA